MAAYRFACEPPRSGLRELLGKMTAHFDVTSRIVEIFESSATTIVALIEMELRSKHTGKPLELQVAEITRSHDGRIVEQTPFYWALNSSTTR